VRLSVPSSVGFLVLLLFAAFVSLSPAQINGPPSSVTSPGFGGHAVNAPPASVTSVGPHGYAPNVYTQVPGDGEHHHHHNDNGAPLLYAFPVPYAVDAPAADNQAQADPDQTDNDPEYQGGPTIFDRRGSGASSYVPPVQDVPKPHAAVAPDASTPTVPTLLVFKDGHNLEIENYAIVGTTLWDLSPGHSRKIALADLDLDATRRKNDDRGVSFEVPSSPQAN
jgi:hypothetical protein